MVARNIKIECTKEDYVEGRDQKRCAKRKIVQKTLLENLTVTKVTITES